MECRGMTGIGYRLLVAHEMDHGRLVLRCGDVPWLVASDWIGEPVISMKDDEVRIIGIMAAKQRGGAFKRLVAAIQADGRVPVVVAPFAVMRAILLRWGWQERRGVDGESEWRPGPLAPKDGG
jgi:hypothetical protein